MEPENIEERVSALESHVGELNRRVRASEQDAQAARVLAGAADRDVADLGGELRDFRAEVRGEFTDFRAEVRGEFTDFRAEVRGEFTDLRGEVRGEFTDLRGEFNDFRGEVNGEINDLRGELSGEINDLRGELSGEINDLRGEFRDFRRATIASFNAQREDMNDRFSQVDKGFIEMRAKFDATAAGQQQIVALISGLIDDRDEPGSPRRSQP